MTDLVKLRELLESATPGDWEAVLDHDPRGQPSVMYRGLVCLVKHDGAGSMAVVAQSDFVSPSAWEANTRLIPALKNAAPALLTAAEECERMRARIEKLEKALREIQGWKRDTLGQRPINSENELTEAFDRGCRMAFYRCAEHAKSALSQDDK